MTQPSGVFDGKVIGTYYTGNNRHGFLFDGDIFITVDVPHADPSQGTQLTGISGDTIVGWYQDTNLNDHSFSYRNGTYTTLDDPAAQLNYPMSANGSFAQGISGRTIVGGYWPPSGLKNFIYNGSSYTTMAAPSNSFAPSVQGIDGDNIVGWYQGAQSMIHGYLYHNGDYKTLDDPNANPYLGTYACGMSGANVVGYYADQHGAYHGFIYNNDVYTTLDNPNAGTGSLEGTYVTGIFSNTIVGYYVDGKNTTHGFIGAWGGGVCDVAVSVSPAGAGRAFGGGAFVAGSLQTATATASNGYYFTNWTRNGVVVSREPSYAFTLASNMNLVANFTRGAVAFQSFSNALATHGNGIYGATVVEGISGTNIVGYFDNNGVNAGFVYHASNFTTLVDFAKTSDSFSSTPVTEAYGVSGSNVVGYFSDDQGKDHGFLYNGSAYTTIDDPLSAGSTQAFGIDGHNIVGQYVDANETLHGFLYTNGSYITLDDPNAIKGSFAGGFYTFSGTRAMGISGTNIVGYYDINQGFRGFLYNGSSYVTLDALASEPNAASTFALGIEGQNIVGYFSIRSGTYGFFYDGSSYVVVDHPAAVLGTYLTGISGRTVVGYYVDIQANEHGFIATLPTPPNDSLTVLAAPGAGGTVAGGGTFAPGSAVTVTASAQSGYSFVNWTEYGEEISRSASYSFAIGSSATLVAHFSANPATYNVTASAAPAGEGTVSGAGTFAAGEWPTVIAATNHGNRFLNWTENGNVVSSTPAYIFALHGNVSLVANFSAIASAYKISVGASPAGGGTVSGAGTFLPDSAQTVTASSKSGYIFVNWTENGSVVSAQPSYTFTLIANRNLVANFIPRGSPKVTITSPKAGQSVTHPSLIISGAVADKAPVSEVDYELNNGAWMPAVPGNSWADWSATVTLLPGVNTIRAYAKDASGSVSPSVMVSVKYIASAPLDLQTNGNGKVAPADNGVWLALGNTYALTATPARNWIFSNWVASGSENFVSGDPALKFSMQPGLVLTANFVTNVFLAAQGAYHGLFSVANAPREQTSSGGFSFNLTSARTFTGKVALGSDSPTLAGAFDVSGHASAIVAKKGKTPLAVVLELNFADQTVTGTVSNGDFVAQLLGDRNGFSSPQPALGFAGRYTFIIPGTNDPASGPIGTGYGAVSVDTLGNVNLAGALADGTAMSQSSAVSRNGYWPVYLNLYGGKGSLWGWNLFTNGTLIAAPSLSWINATNIAKTAVNRSGFTNQAITLVASAYNPARKPLAGTTNAVVILEGGALSLPLTNHVTIAVNNNAIAVTNLPEKAAKLILKITASSGIISGSFVDPAHPKSTIPVNGAVLQNSANAQGFFLGPNQSGTFLLENP
ncbi:MAG TPA: Ig-like domain-containing protein [Verrucomicrobiae bacterium]|nr:Ig-like domain-containing protein [Verrucomicrobiae bacterium]